MRVYPSCLTPLGSHYDALKRTHMPRKKRESYLPRHTVQIFGIAELSMIPICAQGTHAYSQSPPEWTIDSVGYPTEVYDIQASISGSGVVFLHAVQRLKCI